MDERILTILKEVAQEHTEESNTGDLSCCFCPGNRDYDLLVDAVAHKTKCPTPIARELLREAKTPLQAYCVEYDYIAGPYMYGNFSSTEGRMHAKQYITSYNEDEVKKIFPEGKKHNRYNVQITYVKDM